MSETSAQRGPTILAVGRRGSGVRFGPATQPVAGLAADPWARWLGLRTRQDVAREFEAAKEGWSLGTAYHCCFCHRDFVSASGANKHMRSRRECVVLRTDWYGDVPPELRAHRGQQEVRA